MRKIPKFHPISCGENVMERNSFRRVSSELHQTPWKLFIFAKLHTMKLVKTSVLYALIRLKWANLIQLSLSKICQYSYIT